MAAINFPNSPTIGDTYAANGTTFQWDGVKWKVYSLVPEDAIFNSVKLDDGTSGQAGTLSWNPDDGTLDLVMRGGSVVQQVGLEQFYNVKNQSGITIAKGTPVYVNGVVDNSGHVTVLPMIANGTIPSKRFIGIATETITNGNDGYVTSFGYVRDLDTTGTPYTQTWANGDIIYVSQTAAGGLTNVQPTSGLVLPVAVVINAHQNVGTLLVRSGPAISATAEEGVLARTALQSGDNVSELVNDAGYATQAQVTAAVAAVVDAAPAALDTLNELAAALGDDANFASTVTTSLAGKQSTLVSGTNIKTINGTSLLGSGDIATDVPPAGSNQQLQFNNNGEFGASSSLIYDGVSLKVSSGNVESLYSAGDEGGEFRLAKPQTNTVLAGDVTIDIYQNKLRIFENGGSTRGAYIDLTAASGGVGSDLLAGGGGGTWGSITGTLSSQTDLQTALDAKQASLVSGTNIKTINNTSLLGSGNITISGGSAATAVTATASDTSGNYKVAFLNTTGNTTGDYGVLHDSTSNFLYNPNSNTLSNVTLSNVSVPAVNITGTSGALSASVIPVPTTSARGGFFGISQNTTSGSSYYDNVGVGFSQSWNVGAGTYSNVAIGNSTTLSGNSYRNVLIGKNATAVFDSSNAVAVGYGTTSYTNSVAIGGGAQADLSGSVVLGRSARSQTSYCVTIGADSYTSAQHSTVLGYGARDNGYSAIVLNGNNNANTFNPSSNGFFVTGVTSGTANNVLYFDDSTKKITYGAPAGGSVALGDLTNVNITNPTSGQVLKYNGTAWVNGTDETGGGGGEEPPPADVYRSTKITPTQVSRNGSYNTIITFATAADANLVRNFLIKVSTLSTQSNKIVTFALTNNYSNRVTFDSNFQSWSSVQGSSLFIDNYYVNEPYYTSSGVDVAWYSPDFVSLNEPTVLQVNAGGITDLSTLAPGWFPHAVEFYLDYAGPNATRIRPSISPTLTPAITAFTTPTTNVGLFTVDTTNNPPSQVSPFTGISYVMFTLGKYELIDPNAPEPWYTVQNGAQGQLTGSIANPAGFSYQLFGQYDKQVLIGNSPYNGSQYFNPFNSFNNGPSIGDSWNNNQTRTFFTRAPSPSPTINYNYFDTGRGLVAAWAQSLPTNSSTVAGYLSGDDSYSNYDGRGFFGNNYSSYLTVANPTNTPPPGGTVKVKAVMVFSSPVEVALFSTYAAATGILLETFSYQDPSYGTHTRFVFFTCTNDTLARQMCVDQAPILQFSQSPGGPPFQVTHLVWAWWERTL